jgi:UDPglucose 6-dehydrogenase
LRAVHAVADAFAAQASPEAVLVVKSTVPPGTVVTLCERTGRMVVANPEFLREGSAVHDALHPDRVVIGTQNEIARAIMRQLYAPLIQCGVAVVETDSTSAEVIKYASNAFLATKISFINEVANFCEVTQADVTAVARGVGLDPRIGSQFLRPGVGYGGSCFPKDIRALIHAGTIAGYDFRLLPVVEMVNKEQRRRLYERLVRELGGEVAGKRVALWGLAFKANTDDVRESPALYFLQRLIDEGAEVAAYDPAAMENARRFYPSVIYTSSAQDALLGADALVLLTDWPEFLKIPEVEIRRKMRGAILLRGRS